MKESPAYLAFDLGAESGRAVLGRLKEDRVELQELHRFPNGPVRVGDSLHWDILRLWEEMKKGLGLAVQAAGDPLISLGVDAWGVDFGLLDRNDTLLGNPYHYRDQRTEGILARVSSHISQAELYRKTGNQNMAINSLFQLYSMVLAESPQLEVAQTFLTIPDLFNFWFSGEKACEYSISTTTECYCPNSGEWAWGILEKLSIPKHLFGKILPSGTCLGKIRPSILNGAGLTIPNVIAVASHDTQSAIAAVPAATEDYLYISSGTWSLIGVELDHPLISEKSQSYQLTNEGGYGGKTCFLKNMPGLWLLQECRREWARAGAEYSYDDLSRMAASAPSLRSFIDPTQPLFLAPGDMVVRIRSFCQRTGQPEPENPAEVVRCILESLALEYRHVLEQIKELTGFSLPVIHVIGGGSRNEVLSQFTANACGRPVTAGPAEATALGNILVQSIAAGQVDSLTDARALVRRSVETREYEPADAGLWAEAYDRYMKLRRE
jgi:rhamnulokinase